LKLDALFAELESDLAVISRFGLMDVVQDKVLAYGEKLGSWFFAHLLESRGMRTRRLSGEELGILTDSAFLDANIMFDESAKNAVKSLEGVYEEIPVITGFIGKNADGQTTTLGRGGSDTTACFLGAALHAHKVILWKEVDGVLSADPRIVAKARTIPYISYEEAEESGKVICDKAIQYLKMFETPGEVASLTDPAKGTQIGPKNDSEKGVKIISSKKDLAHMVITDEKVKEYGFLYQISKVFTNHRVNMVIIRNTRDRLYIVIENGGHERVKASLDELKELGYHIVTTPVAMVTVIGNLEWKDVNTFNNTLSVLSKDAPLGAFPYRNCTRLEAVVKNEELETVIKGFHDVFIQREI
jgi:aspartate kinase